MITQYVDLEHRRYNVIILAGGLGSRIGEQSMYIPKAMSRIGESIAIDVLIQQFQNVAYKYIIGTATHAHLLQTHIRGGFPDYPIVFSRETELVNNAKSFMYCLDNTDCRYPTILVFCDAIQLGDPIITSDTFYIVDENTKGHTGTYRAGIEQGNVVMYDSPKNTGMYPQWVISDTTLLKSIVYSNPEITDLVGYIKKYHDIKFMKSIPVKMALEIGTETDLMAVRKIWETI